MHWDDEALRHRPLASNPSGRTIERASGIFRSANPEVTPTSQAPRVGDEYDEPTVPVDKPEEDGTLKAYVAALERLAEEDEDKRKQPGGQAANWGAGQNTPQRIRDEIMQGQGVDLGAFGTEARRKTASLWDQIAEPRHKVAGWDWDEILSGYVAEGAADFACICGSNVAAPGQVVCACGKIWNSYTISHEGSTRLVCREVPVRENVLLARRLRP